MVLVVSWIGSGSVAESVPVDFGIVLPAASFFFLLLDFCLLSQHPALVYNTPFRRLVLHLAALGTEDMIVVNHWAGVLMHQRGVFGTYRDGRRRCHVASERSNVTCSSLSIQCLLSSAVELWTTDQMFINIDAVVQKLEKTVQLEKKAWRTFDLRKFTW